MCFVTVRHEISGEAGVAVVEEQDIVYRQEPSPARTAPPRANPAPQGASLQKGAPSGGPKRITPDETMLFRYSAITYNAHLIPSDQTGRASGRERVCP